MTVPADVVEVTARAGGDEHVMAYGYASSVEAGQQALSWVRQCVLSLRKRRSGDRSYRIECGATCWEVLGLDDGSVLVLADVEGELLRLVTERALLT